MKSAIIVGLVAGFVSGLVHAGLSNSGIWELFSVNWLAIPVSTDSIPISIQYTVLFHVMFSSLWGIVFCILYAFFYDYIPFKGVKKGLIFGLIIWVAITAYPASINFGYGWTQIFVPWLFTYFISRCIVYGSLIGILYKKK